MQQVCDLSRAVTCSCMLLKADRQPPHAQVSRSKAASSKARFEMYVRSLFLKGPRVERWQQVCDRSQRTRRNILQADRQSVCSVEVGTLIWHWYEMIKWQQRPRSCSRADAPSELPEAWGAPHRPRAAACILQAKVEKLSGFTPSIQPEACGLGLYARCKTR